MAEKVRQAADNIKQQKKKNTGRAPAGKQRVKSEPKKNAAEKRPAAQTPKTVKTPKTRKTQILKVIPLGGLHEVGKNLTLFEYGNDIMIVDCGMTFPNDEMYGIDVVIPDFTYLRDNRSKIRGVVLTHGHEDHIGAVPFLVQEFNVPVYGTRLTLGLVQHKLDERKIKGDLHTISAGDKIKLGVFNVEAIRVTHSVADSICLCIETPVGRIFHTGDFKVDYTPVDGEPIDFARLAEIGKSGVLLMLADSTNAMRPGFTESESLVGRTLGTIFSNAKSRIIIATFSSNVHRVQRIIDIAVQYGRKVAISGRSMENVVNVATELGYLKIPRNVLVDINKTKNIPDKELCIITTGSQGEPMSALSRMAAAEHKSIKIKQGDLVIFSSTPVPGNEKSVSNVVNRLMEDGAEVVYSDIADTHVSGHACQEELKLMHSLIRPKYFMPAHGEVKHLTQHAKIAESLGMPQENIFILNNGDMLEVTKTKLKKTEGFAPAEPVLVDGLGVGDVGSVVLRDRKTLSESGLIIVVAALDASEGYVVSGPEIISRGFVYVKENEDIIEEARKIAAESLDKSYIEGNTDWNAMKNAVRDDLRKYIYNKTNRSPMILPVFMEV